MLFYEEQVNFLKFTQENKWTCFAFRSFFTRKHKLRFIERYW